MQDICSTLDQLLDQYAADDAFTFHAIHGYMTASAVVPFEQSIEERNEIFFGQPVKLSDQHAKEFDAALTALARIIDRDFNEEEGFSLSCDEFADPDDEDLMDWCCGFVQAHILSEEKWFVENEQEVSELLLPVMLGSGLFDDEPDFEAILSDEQLTEDMCSQIPEVLMELYLLFNSPEEGNKPPVKPKGNPQKKHPRKKRK
ncbi:YecA family protein [Endozoicomonas sp. OPT23]|uniref:YecA/YgfB family protein n=1 Tax=Endozoicomonas sp. OPT23 TaxID=2072845 RepID=UPI00107FDD1E|nr:YecA family protein [Endozoicomonas sp. OPT23]MRI32482.1 YecA family protein [Endozoicomonas sp. OPT23]